MKFGYARVSTIEQNLNLQIDALLKEGIEIENIFADKVTGSSSEREKLNKLLEMLKKAIRSMFEKWIGWSGALSLLPR